MLFGRSTIGVSAIICTNERRQTMIVIILIVLIPVLVIVISASAISFVRAVVDRILFYKQIKQICKDKNYKITFPRKLLASFFRHGDKPDLIVETFDKNYLVRFITCKNKNLFYNFPTPEWYVSFERVLSAPINPTGRFKHLPPFDKKYYCDNIENKSIMIFAPNVPKISYLKDKNSKRELVGSSAEMDDWTVYSSKCFIKIV